MDCFLPLMLGLTEIMYGFSLRSKEEKGVREGWFLSVYGHMKWRGLNFGHNPEVVQILALFSSRVRFRSILAMQTLDGLLGQVSGPYGGSGTNHSCLWWSLTILSTICHPAKPRAHSSSWANLIIITFLWKYDYFYSHFTDEKNEVQINS